MFERDILSSELGRLTLKGMKRPMFSGLQHFNGFADHEQENNSIIKFRKQVVLDLIDYNPNADNTIVIGKKEFDTGIEGIKNYKGWKLYKTKTGIIDHNTLPKKYRDISKVTFLVLHETATPVHVSNGFSPPDTSHFAILGDRKHFAKDGPEKYPIRQFNDLAEIENHTYGFNDVAIGIEFANESWLRHVPKRSETDKIERLYPEKGGFLALYWGPGYNIYKIPTSLTMLEKEVELVRWLTTGFDTLKQNARSDASGLEFSVPNITPDWIQLISYNDFKDKWGFTKKTKNRADRVLSVIDKSKPTFFVASKGYDLFSRKDLEARGIKSGISSHDTVNVVSKKAHQDGLFQSLYTWLRIKKDKAPLEAYEICKKLLMEDWLELTVKGGSHEGKPVYILDVSDAKLIERVM